MGAPNYFFEITEMLHFVSKPSLCNELVNSVTELSFASCSLTVFLIVSPVLLLSFQRGRLWLLLMVNQNKAPQCQHNL